MYPDILDMKRFYADYPGLLAREVISKTIQSKTKPHPSQTILGLGYTSPFLRPFLGKIRRVLSFAPAAQGVIAWPQNDKISTALMSEDLLPLPDSCVDILILSHILEHTKDINAVMAECKRVLAATGKIIIVVPNRSGIWAQLERTPFGYGRPFSAFQLQQLLVGANFAVDEITAALFTPPTNNKYVLKFSNQLERLKRWPFPRVGGVLVAVAHQDIFAPIKGKRIPIQSMVWKPQPIKSYKNTYKNTYK